MPVARGAREPEPGPGGPAARGGLGNLKWPGAGCQVTGSSSSDAPAAQLAVTPGPDRGRQPGGPASHTARARWLPVTAVATYIKFFTNFPLRLSGQ